MNKLHAISWTSVSILMSLLLKSAFMYVLMSVFWGENYNVLHQKNTLPITIVIVQLQLCNCKPVDKTVAFGNFFSEKC